jgi:SAM-dependent methyltransferase
MLVETLLVLTASVFVFIALLGGVIMLFRLRTVLFFGGAPFVASSRANISKAISLAEIKLGDRTADLGSGDGLVLFALAPTLAAEIVGFEIDPLLVATTVRDAKKKNLDQRIRVEKQNFWHADLSPFDAVFIFQIPYAMPRLAEKLKRELKPGSRVVSNNFRFKDWNPLNQYG